MAKPTNAPIVAATLENINRAAAVIAAGGIVAVPTDTMYGLAVDPMSSSAVDALFAVKERNHSQVVPMLAANLEQVQVLAAMSSQALRLATYFWPGPLTLVMPARVSLCSGVVNAHGGAGIRIPACKIARAVAAKHGFAITASSANKHKATAAMSAEAAARISGVELVLASDFPATATPSTVLDMTQKQPRLLRFGAVSTEKVEKYLGQSLLIQLPK